MKIAVVGIGAVGGLLAARLAQAGHAVVALARGETLRALQRGGVRLEEADGRATTVALPASDRASDLGAQDLVVIALKAHALPALAPDLAPLLGRDTVVLPAMNGVPWWFLQTLPADALPPPSARKLVSVDPDGRIAEALPLGRVLGAVVHLSCSSPAPGVARRGFGNRLIVGEPGGGRSARAEAVAAALREAGFDAEHSDDVRREIWFKLWGNMTTNPISALTGATADRILADPLVTAFMGRAMGEAAAIGARIGCPIAQSSEERMAVTRQLGAFKTSMLQDAEAGRPLELGALVGAVHEIGRALSLDTPYIDALLGLTRLMAAERGLLPAG